MKKLAKTAAMIVAAVFVLGLVLVGGPLVPEYWTAQQVFDRAEKDGAIVSDSECAKRLPKMVLGAISVRLSTKGDRGRWPPAYSEAAGETADRLLRRYAANKPNATYKYGRTRGLLALRLDAKLTPEQLLCSARLDQITKDARIWFSKSPANLSLAEAAFLAVPRVVDGDVVVFRHSRRAMAYRAVSVLGDMKEAGLIAEDQSWRAQQDLPKLAIGPEYPIL